ncbi:MAG: hypothetical protein E2O39_11320 [Planctomycetota bacterium]|nr:MAG: hypothetical protein E2O39_11320 [Planctomycetota bacterium]
MNKILVTSALCLASAATFAFNDAGRAVTPDRAIVAGVDAIRKNNLKGFLEATFSREQMREMEQAWNTKRKTKSNPIEDAQFAETMQMLTAPGAEAQLMAMVEPKLEEMRPQMGMLVGMMSGFAQSTVDQNADLSSDEKKQAQQVLAGFVKALQENDLTSSDLARKAVGIVCKTARRLKLDSMDDVRALDFRHAVYKGDVILRGTKELLAVYGFTVDKWLDSVKAETIDEDGDEAVVRVSYEMFGVQQTVDTEMVRVDGRWIHKENGASESD